MQPDLPSLELFSRGPLRVRLCFVWSGDRYAHRLAVTDGGQEQVCFESLEGAAGEAWPPSPALQQLSFQPGVSGSQCALLVGMAGKSHWSLSVEANESSLIFDVACRVLQPPERLGSSYRVTRLGTRGSRIRENSDGSQQGPNSHEFGYGRTPKMGQAPGIHVLEPVSFSENLTLVVEVEANEGVMVRDDREGRLAILPAGRIGDSPATVRWRYRLRLIPPDEPSFAGAGT